MYEESGGDVSLSRPSWHSLRHLTQWSVSSFSRCRSLCHSEWVTQPFCHGDFLPSRWRCPVSFKAAASGKCCSRVAMLTQRGSPVSQNHSPGPALTVPGVCSDGRRSRSMSLCSCLCSGDGHCVCLSGVLWGVNQVARVECLEQCLAGEVTAVIVGTVCHRLALCYCVSSSQFYELHSIWREGNWMSEVTALA